MNFKFIEILTVIWLFSFDAKYVMLCIATEENKPPQKRELNVNGYDCGRFHNLLIRKDCPRTQNWTV